MCERALPEVGGHPYSLYVGTKKSGQTSNQPSHKAIHVQAVQAGKFQRTKRSPPPPVSLTLISTVLTFGLAKLPAASTASYVTCHCRGSFDTCKVPRKHESVSGGAANQKSVVPFRFVGVPRRKPQRCLSYSKAPRKPLEPIHKNPARVCKRVCLGCACRPSRTHLHGFQNLEVGRDIHPFVRPVVVDYRGTPRPEAVFAQALAYVTQRRTHRRQ